jgi:hypothetical protein
MPAPLPLYPIGNYVFDLNGDSGPSEACAGSGFEAKKKDAMRKGKWTVSTDSFLMPAQSSTNAV